MKILLIHSDYVKYEAKSRTKLAEDVVDEDKKSQECNEALVVFTAVEKADEKEQGKVVEKACSDIEKVYSEVKAESILIYPYAHLSSSLSRPDIAVKILKEMELKLGKKYPVKRAPFGWYKAFELRCKGHPLSELSREIVVEEASDAVKAEKKLESEWYVLDTGGKLVPASKFNFSKHPSLRIFYEYETTGTRAMTREPPHIKLMREHAFVDYEPGSDQGNFRWYPKGELIKKLLEEHVTGILLAYGAMEVETPVMYDMLHPQLSKYLNRFPARQYVVKSDDREYFLRFAACFGQYLMKRDMGISYRHLPLRVYELTHYSFRREQSGELAGLKRLRAFTMPDMHTLCRDMEQARKEFIDQYRLSMRWMEDIEVEYDIAVRVVRDFYDENKELIKELVKLAKRPMLVEIWDKRLFYFVMKFEFSVNDALKKSATLSTVQIDVENTELFDINYVDEDGSKKHPVMLHASISGGIDRNLYAILESEAMKMRKGKKPMLPTWLSPTQVRLVPVAEEYLEHCKQLLTYFNEKGIRADVDDESETLQKKVMRAEKEWIPYIAVIGKREIESGSLTVRIRSDNGRQKNITKEELASMVKKETLGKPSRRLSLPQMLSKRPRFR